MNHQIYHLLQVKKVVWGYTEWGYTEEKCGTESSKCLRCIISKEVHCVLVLGELLITVTITHLIISDLKLDSS